MSSAIVVADVARQLRICSDALGAARPLLALSTGLSVVAAAGVALAGAIAGMTAVAFWAATLALGVLAHWAGFRVRFDAALFARLADEAQRVSLDLVPFDDAMARLGLLRADKAGRDVAARCRGALTLLRALALIVVMQAVVLVLAGARLAGG